MITAEQIARSYDLSVSSLWREDSAGSPFLRWLDGFRCPAATPIPHGLPRAYSVMGGGGRGLRWYEVGDTIIGVPGGETAACYCVPATATFEPAPAPAPLYVAGIEEGAARPGEL